MGYRSYFYKIDKDTLNTLYKSTEEELTKFAKDLGILQEDEKYIPLYEIGKPVFCFGKYYENADKIIALGNPLFADPILQEMFSSYHAVIIGKDAIRCAIDFYKDKIIEMFKEMHSSTDEEMQTKYGQNRENYIKEYLRDCIREWSGTFITTEGKEIKISDDGYVVNLNLQNKKLSSSDMPEYAIFELVNLYKTFDWENYGLVFLGW